MSLKQRSEELEKDSWIGICKGPHSTKERDNNYITKKTARKIRYDMGLENWVGAYTPQGLIVVLENLDFIL